MRYLLQRLAMLAVILAAGCSSVLAPQPDRSKFFVLTTVQSADENVAQSQAQFSIGLGPVKLPDYLDRSEIVTRVEPNRLDLSESDRWAEPIDANFRNVLAANIGAQLPNAQIVTFPWYSTTHLERNTAGAAQLVAHWTIHDGATNKLLAARDSSFNEPAKSPEMGDAVAAMSQDVDDLSVQIVSEMHRLTNQTRADVSALDARANCGRTAGNDLGSRHPLVAAGN
jgi:uncharacterized protein